MPAERVKQGDWFNGGQPQRDDADDRPMTDDGEPGPVVADKPQRREGGAQHFGGRFPRASTDQGSKARNDWRRDEIRRALGRADRCSRRPSCLAARWKQPMSSSIRSTYMYVSRVTPYCPRGTLTGVKALKRRCHTANVIPNGEDKWMRDVGSGGQVAPRRVSTGQQGRRRPEEEESSAREAAEPRTAAVVGQRCGWGRRGSLPFDPQHHPA